MWPFTKKAIPFPYSNIGQQVELALKSVSYPETQPTWRLYGRSETRWNSEKAIVEGYCASAVVYAAIEKRAKLVASVPWKVKIKTPDGYEDAPEGHPLQVLMDNPNPDQSGYEFFYSAEQAMCISGNNFISEIKAGANNLPVELWQLPASRMKIHPGNKRLIDKYRFEAHNGGRDIASEDMIQLRMPNPHDPLWGMPPLMAAAMPTDIDREAGAFQKVSLQNRGLSDISIKLPEGATSEQADQVRDKLRERQQGPANARAPIVSTGEVNQLNQTAAEMDFVNSRKSVWSEIAAVFGTPLSTLGFTEDVNLANAEAMDKQLWQNTIIPQLELYKRQLNSQLASEFNKGTGPKVELFFDISNVQALQEGMDKKLGNANLLFGMGVPFNTINQKLELGFDEIEGGDTGYVGAGLLPVGYDPMGSTETDIEEAVKNAVIAYGKK